MLSEQQLQRYKRHVLLPNVSIEGQEKLLNAKVMIVGMGGLGCPASLYLTAAGIGKIGLLDFDIVEPENLQRQILYSTKDLGKHKVKVAAKKLKEINPDVDFKQFNVKLTAQNALSIFSDYDYIIDGTDNFATRYLVNDACVLLNKTNIYGSIFRFEGQVTVFARTNSPCYRCLFPIPPKPGEIPNCSEAGVLGILPGIIGTTQAAETIKLILGIGEPLTGKLLIFDSLQMQWQKMNISKNKQCPICGTKKITSLIDYEEFCNQTNNKEIKNITASELLEIQNNNSNNILILDVRDKIETMFLPPLKGATIIPLRKLKSRIEEIISYKEKTVVVYCTQGKRSIEAVKILQASGFKNLNNLKGGLLKYIKDKKNEN